MPFVPWYQEFHPVLVAALTLVGGDPDAAVDAANEGLVRALERWDRVESLPSPEVWTYLVAIDLLGKWDRRRFLPKGWRRRHRWQGPTDPESRLTPEIAALIGTLPPPQREALALRYLLGLSDDQVADTMGVAIGTVSSTLAAAHRRLAAPRSDDEAVGTEK